METFQTFLAGVLAGILAAALHPILRPPIRRLLRPKHNIVLGGVAPGLPRVTREEGVEVVWPHPSGMKQSLVTWTEDDMRAFMKEVSKGVH